MSFLRNSTMGSIQLGPTLTLWTWTTFPVSSVGLYKSSIRMTWGKLYAEDVVRVAKELACVFPLLGMCNRLKDSNSDCKCLTWLKYPCILSSLASNSLFTCPTTSLESENIFTIFPHILWTMDIPSSKASYSTSLFVAKKPNLNDFSMVSFSGETSTSSTPDPLWVTAPSTYTFQWNGSCRKLSQLTFHLSAVLLSHFLTGL